MKHFNIRIHGEVQGVGFRYAAKREADELGLCGFVRNELDGSVYVEIEGQHEIVQKFLEWCRQGSKFGSIAKVTVEETQVRNCSSFDIL